jgi:hypothetical protein
MINFSTTTAMADQVKRADMDEAVVKEFAAAFDSNPEGECDVTTEVTAAANETLGRPRRDASR